MRKEICKNKTKEYFMFPKLNGKKVFYTCGAKDIINNTLFLCPKCKKEADLK